MTTLTIEIPDSESSVLSAITDITTKAGLRVTIDKDDDGFSESEFNTLKDACNEAILIKKGLAKPISSSELWND